MTDIDEQWKAACNKLLKRQPYPICYVYPEEVRDAAQIMRNEIERLNVELAALRSAQQCEEPDTYDAGLLGHGGGGDVDWWHTYIRHELERAHEFYAQQFQSIAAPSQQWRGIESAPELLDICTRRAYAKHPQIAFSDALVELTGVSKNAPIPFEMAGTEPLRTMVAECLEAIADHMSGKLRPATGADQ